MKFVLDCPLLLSQFIDEDCTLEEEEEEDGPVEDEDEIDQYNDDTFGAGAIGEFCWKSPLICYLFTLKLYNTFPSYVTFANYISKFPEDTEPQNGSIICLHSLVIMHWVAI